MTKTIASIGAVALLAVLAIGCDKKETGAGAPGATKAATGGGDKCDQAAVKKAKLKDPSVDPSTLGSVEFDKMDCKGGKWPAAKADCILAAKDLEAAKKCD